MIVITCSLHFWTIIRIALLLLRENINNIIYRTYPTKKYIIHQKNEHNIKRHRKDQSLSRRPPLEDQKTWGTHAPLWRHCHDYTVYNIGCNHNLANDESFQQKRCQGSVVSPGIAAKRIGERDDKLWKSRGQAYYVCIQNERFHGAEYSTRWEPKPYSDVNLYISPFWKHRNLDLDLQSFKQSHFRVDLSTIKSAVRARR